MYLAWFMHRVCFGAGQLWSALHSHRAPRPPSRRRLQYFPHGVFQAASPVGIPHQAQSPIFRRGQLFSVATFLLTKDN